MGFETDLDWNDLIWSPDGLQLTCVGPSLLAAISMVPQGQSSMFVI